MMGASGGAAALAAFSVAAEGDSVGAELQEAISAAKSRWATSSGRVSSVSAAVSGGIGKGRGWLRLQTSACAARRGK